jgi:hypothetical protein
MPTLQEQAYPIRREGCPDVSVKPHLISVKHYACFIREFSVRNRLIQSLSPTSELNFNCN